MAHSGSSYRYNPKWMDKVRKAEGGSVSDEDDIARQQQMIDSHKMLRDMSNRNQPVDPSIGYGGTSWKNPDKGRSGSQNTGSEED